MGYQREIGQMLQELGVQSVTSVEVEASMRLMYGTLDHLSREDFRAEIAIAVDIKAVEPDALEDAARSLGLAA